MRPGGDAAPRSRRRTREGRSHAVKLMAGRTVLGTGATSGIGRASAVGPASLGARVAITGRDRVRADDAARKTHAAGGQRVDVFVADLSSQFEVRRLAADVLERRDGSTRRSTTWVYWNTRRVTVDELQHLRPQRSRAVPAHQPAPGPARAGPASSRRSPAVTGSSSTTSSMRC
ncbi:MAG: SDR family NAD(P)-dependent oxidoreductase [Ornithinimicrobium sp.]|uniref:SDR family NAD(P)-dependent oxidoreductase n=1 Tax=Ornithinimicrobium sp. TaxID=1977084 RepID=UPI003D9AE352